MKELDERLKEKRAIRWCIAVALSVIGLGGFVSDLVQRNEEKTRMQNAENEQRAAGESVRQQLQQSELNRISDTRYLQGKLDVFAQFAPAIFKLARATEENTRKQYEAKMLSNKELYDAAVKAAKSLREFGQKRQFESAQQMDAESVALRAATNEAEKQKVWADQTSRMVQLYYQQNAEFRSSILPDAVYVRNELLKRGIPEPPPSPMRPASMVQMVFEGSLAGPYPEFGAADYLEQMAKQLPLK